PARCESGIAAPRKPGSTSSDAVAGGDRLALSGPAGEPSTVCVDRCPGGRTQHRGGIFEDGRELSPEHRPPVRGGPCGDPRARRVPQYDDHGARVPVLAALLDHRNLLPPDAEGVEGPDDRDALVIDDELAPRGDEEEGDAEDDDEQAQQRA